MRCGVFSSFPSVGSQLKEDNLGVQIAALKKVYPTLSFDSCDLFKNDDAIQAFLSVAEMNSRYILGIVGESKSWDILDKAIRLREEAKEEIVALKKEYDKEYQGMVHQMAEVDSQLLINLAAQKIHLMHQQETELKKMDSKMGEDLESLSQQVEQTLNTMMITQDEAKFLQLASNMQNIQDQISARKTKFEADKSQCCQKYLSALHVGSNQLTMQKDNAVFGIRSRVGQILIKKEKEIVPKQQLALKKFKIGVLLCPTRVLLWQVSNHYYFNMVSGSVKGKEGYKVMADKILDKTGKFPIPYAKELREWIQKRNSIPEAVSTVSSSSTSFAPSRR